jgi:pterin-4a-carbinolamine dehydratase
MLFKLEVFHPEVFVQYNWVKVSQTQQSTMLTIYNV